MQTETAGVKGGVLDPVKDLKPGPQIKPRVKIGQEYNPCRLDTGTEAKPSDKVFSYRRRDLVAQAHREAQPGWTAGHFASIHLNI